MMTTVAVSVSVGAFVCNSPASSCLPLQPGAMFRDMPSAGAARARGCPSSAHSCRCGRALR
eukprot:4747611-Pyramimonas_sp.AAC.1